MLHVRVLTVHEDGADVEFWIKEGSRIIARFPPMFIHRSDVMGGYQTTGKFPFTIDTFERDTMDSMSAHKLMIETKGVHLNRTPREALLNMEVRNKLGTRGWGFSKPAWLPEGEWARTPIPLKITRESTIYKPGSITIIVPTAGVTAKGTAPRANRTIN